MMDLASKPSISRTLQVATLVLLCATLYLAPAICTPFFTKGEPREALVVRQMLEEGDWILPKRASANGLTIASKPPLFHWLGALASRAAGGTSELSVRLPSLLLGTAAVVLVWFSGRALLSARAALAAAIVLATSFEWVRAASTARVDATLTALMTATLLLFYTGFARGGLPPLTAVAAYLCLGLATLTKGPVGFVLPLLVLGTALLAQGKLRLLPRFHPLLGIVVISMVAGSWYASAWWLGGDAFFHKQVLKENVFRFLAASKLASGHEHSFYYYLPTLSAGLLPWTPLAVLAIWAAVRNPTARREPQIAFLLVWFGVVLVFYCLASAKRSVYLLPLYPAAALLTGWFWDGITRGERMPGWLRGRSLLWVNAAAVIAVLVLLIVILLEGFGFSPLDILAPFLHRKDRANLPIVRDLVQAHLSTVVVGLAFIVANLAALLWAFQRNRWAVVGTASAATAAALWLLVFGVFQPALAERRTFAPFVRTAVLRTGGHRLFFYPGTFDYGARFYAPPKTDQWRAERRHQPEPDHVLVWDELLAGLPANERAQFEVLATSDTTDPEGTKHLSLARIR